MITLGEKIGQMFMVGLRGEALGRDERLIIEQYGIGGFILFNRNCCAPAQILSLCRALWETGTELPPFIAIDQEGGRVHRLPAPFTHFPAAGLIGDRGSADLAYRVARAAAAELSLTGINLNFAPVLDVNSNPRNPIIGDRSFASTAAAVMGLSAPWIQGLRAGGIIPCGKHFPGHGDTDKDSHVDRPVVEKSLDALKATELAPFAHACQNRIEALMSAHVVYPALDADLPATLSERIVTDLLRQQLGYDGVVFSDDLEMKAISTYYGEEQAAGLAVRAGVDVLLYGHDLPKAIRAWEFLRSEAEVNPALRARIEKSYRRIARLKHSRLKAFTGVGEKLAERLARLEHRHVVNEVYGNL